jgi:EAL and modified HD-GYP domain-containing signal transduction protein
MGHGLLVDEPAETGQGNFCFVARQPILTADEKVYAYELLFRDGLENFCRASSPKDLSCSTLDTSLLLGLDTLCGSSFAFVNCTRDLLLQNLVAVLPPAQTVVEVLETVPPDEEVIQAIRQLKSQGYLIALDDFVPSDPRQPLIALADIIKVDLKLTGLPRCKPLVAELGPTPRLLAEKVETRKEFQACRKFGFHLFQGYFFCRPEIVKGRDIPGNRINHLRMLQALAQPQLNLREVEQLIKSEAALCYRLLRYLNSAAFAFRSEIHSVRHALSIPGELEIRRWVGLVAAVSAGQGRCGELVCTALVRARFGELLAPKVPHGNSDLFLMGLFSLMDALLDSSMTSTLEKLPLDSAIKNVLLGYSSPLEPAYRLMLAQECGNWSQVAETCDRLRLDSKQVAGLYWNAMAWAREVSSEAGDGALT